MSALTEEQVKELREQAKRVTVLYPRVKAQIIASEKRDKENRLSIPAINELRNAFDHLMRVQSVIDLNDTSGPERAKIDPFEYCKINIDKALGHVYRAGYDALDVLSLRLLDDINHNINGYQMSTLVSVFNDFSSEVQVPLDKTIDLCDEAKNEKDVESIEAQYTTYNKYEEAIEKLKEIEKKFIAKQKALQSFDAEQNKKYRTQRNYAIAALVVSVVTFIISLLL